MDTDDSAQEPSPEFDAQRIIAAFDRHHVECVIVGGVAAQAHGATRPTSDLDCVARFDRQNLERPCMAMRELNARIRADGFSDAEAIALAPTMLHPDTFAHVEISTWLTDAGPLDVLHDMPASDGARRNFEDLVDRASERNLGGIRVLVAALDDIVASKQFADRPKDHDALPELRQLQARIQRRPDT